MFSDLPIGIEHIIAIFAIIASVISNRYQTATIAYSNKEQAKIIVEAIKDIPNNTTDTKKIPQKLFEEIQESTEFE